MIERTTLMIYLKADADMICHLRIDFLSGNHDKPCRIILIVLNRIAQHLKSIDLCILRTGDRGLMLIIVLLDLARSHRIVADGKLLPLLVFL